MTKETTIGANGNSFPRNPPRLKRDPAYRSRAHLRRSSPAPAPLGPREVRAPTPDRRRRLA